MLTVAKLARAFWLDTAMVKEITAKKYKNRKVSNK